MAEQYVYNSTYAFSENKVINHLEIEGLEALSLKDHVNSNGALGGLFSYALDWYSQGARKMVSAGLDRRQARSQASDLSSNITVRNTRKSLG